jgi:hypothetical protein
MTEREQHLATLKAYQSWRTGEYDRQYDELGLTPQAITDALDGAIAELEKKPYSVNTPI